MYWNKIYGDLNIINKQANTRPLLNGIWLYVYPLHSFTLINLWCQDLRWHLLILNFSLYPAEENKQKCIKSWHINNSGKVKVGIK